jgi:hypothetical protein
MELKQNIKFLKQEVLERTNLINCSPDVNNTVVIPNHLVQNLLRGNIDGQAAS